MGISRSGRVRKKSSKLTDFQSTDDIDVARIKKNSSIKKSFLPIIKNEPELNLNQSDDENDFNDGQTMDFSDDIGDSDLLEDSDLLDSRTKKSIYITEKSSKKKMLKDGKIVLGKGPRKDKGKSRFTAYMLWAKEVRQDMLYSHPEMDFASISKKLGEMWSNVPSNEKYNWKRRAKRLSAKGKDLPKGTSKLAAMSKFLNKNTPFKGKKPQSIANRSINKIANKTSIASTSTISAIQQNSIQKTSPANYKITGETNSDIAAYLKLLGDSLCLIGERLKEHDGQITVSGSLSVLLDSLLCSIGPLMCLTTYVPSLGQNTNHSKDVMRDMLDNIAYVMPGL